MAKATDKSTSRRAVLTALATAPLAGSTAQAVPIGAERPELAQLHGAMLAIMAEWNAIPDSTDEQGDRYADRLYALEEHIIATPGESLADVMLKLRVLRRFEYDYPAPGRGPHEELWEMADSEVDDILKDRLICSIARDIQRLATG